MNKLKLFLENMLVYGIGGVIGKIIPLIMVPIVTRMIPDTTYYGISDLSNTLVSLTSSIAVLGMYDAVYRIFFDSDDIKFKRKVCSTAFLFTFVMSILIFALMLIYKESIAIGFFTDKKYISLVYISAVSTLVGATNTIVSTPTRMQNKRKQYLFVNIISPLVAYGIAIFLLIKGLYLVALPLGTMISSLLVEAIYWGLNKKWFRPNLFDWKILKELLKLAIPLFPNFLIYWVFNSCDRLMIADMLGTAASGIYTVGAKLGNCSQLIYVAFAGGWQYFAFSTMKEENQVDSNSKIFEYMGIISYAAGIIVCAWSYFIYQKLFVGDYQKGYIVASYLFFAPLLQMLEQIIGNQFLVIKKAWPTTCILSIGAIVNVILNYFLIPVLGIEGAAIATLMGYATAVVICAIVLLKLHLLVLSPKFICITLSILCYIVVWRIFLTHKIILGTFLAFAIIMFELILYKKEIEILIYSLKHKKI